MKDLVSGRHQDMYFKCGEVLISDAVQTDDLNSTKTGDAFQVLRKCGNGFGVEALPFQGYEYAVVRNGVLPARLGFVDKDFCGRIPSERAEAMASLQTADSIWATPS